MKFTKLVKAGENWEVLRSALYKTLSDVAWNNSKPIDFSKEDVQKAFDWCLEKFFEDTNIKNTNPNG